MKRSKIIGFRNGGWMIGEIKKKHSKSKRKRTMITYQNKIKRIRNMYNRLSKKPKFKEKYPTAESFLGNYKLKEVTK